MLLEFQYYVSRELGEVISFSRLTPQEKDKFSGFDGVMLILKTYSASPQPKSYCMMKNRIIQEVTLLVQNSLDLDWKADKYFWWRAAPVIISAKLRRWGIDPGPDSLWMITGMNIVYVQPVIIVRIIGFRMDGRWIGTMKMATSSLDLVQFGLATQIRDIYWLSHY